MSAGFIICGWYRDDTAYLVPRLTRTLEAYRLRHDFVRITDERSATVIRPEQALQAMNRNPGNVVVLLDAGATINTTVDELHGLNGDVDCTCASNALAVAAVRATPSAPVQWCSDRTERHVGSYSYGSR